MPSPGMDDAPQCRFQSQETLFPAKYLETKETMMSQNMQASDTRTNKNLRKHSKQQSTDTDL